MQRRRQMGATMNQTERKFCVGWKESAVGWSKARTFAVVATVSTAKIGRRRTMVVGTEEKVIFFCQKM